MIDLLTVLRSILELFFLIQFIDFKCFMWFCVFQINIFTSKIKKKVTELEALLCLQHVPNLGDSSIKKLIQIVGSAVAVLEEKKANLLKIDGIGKVKIASIHNKDHVTAMQKEIDFIKKNKIQCITYLDKEYPYYLKQCLDSPVILFYSGKMDLLQRRMISIVGTRKITTYGRQFCEQLIEDLVPFNPIIVSGFAYGVDIAAHKAAMKNNLQTIACLGHGLNQIYPKSHKQYMSQMEENGGFLTDFWSDATFIPQNFLKRNRIIAGISQATIVIESADKGGSLVTAQMANSYNRDVFALPGRATDAMSIGCNMLIKTQQAHLITSVADLVYLLNWDTPIKKEKVIQPQLFIDLNTEEQSVVDFLAKSKKQDLDSIAIECKMPTYKLASLLLNLELKGVVQPLPGKLFDLV